MELFFRIVLKFLSSRFVFSLTFSVANCFRRLLPEISNLVLQRAGEALFLEAEYTLARRCFDAVSSGKYRGFARKMTEWIAYKNGEVSLGWPRYNLNELISTEPVVTDTVPLIVAKYELPNELVHGLGLPRLKGEPVGELPVLVWFNFNTSLGGELLAAKVVLAWLKERSCKLILVCDPRIVSVIKTNFSHHEVISRESDLSSLRGRCQAFVLARDLLAKVVQSEADFAKIAAFDFVLPAAIRPARAQGRRKVALSWKTGNKLQGRYRNLQLAELICVLERHNLEYISVQHGVNPAEAKLLADRLGDRFHPVPIDTSGSVEEIAVALSALDLVVTIDNTNLHIAGAYSVPCFAMISVPSYWAWPIDGAFSRWYRSVKLIHQRKPGCWSDVMEKLDEELKGAARSAEREGA